MLNTVHSSIWTCISILKKEYNLNQFKVKQPITRYLSLKKMKYKDSALQIKKLVKITLLKDM